MRLTVCLSLLLAGGIGRAWDTPPHRQITKAALDSLPAKFRARLGIFGSVFLGLARALGETMAVTMVIGNDPSIHASLFAPGYTIAAIIANEFTEATGTLHLQALVALGLVLFLLTIVINAMARLLIIATTRRGSSHP